MGKVQSNCMNSPQLVVYNVGALCMYVRMCICMYVRTYVCAVHSLQIQINARIVVVGSSDTATSLLETLVTAKSVCMCVCVYIRTYVYGSVQVCMSACGRTYSVCMHVLRPQLLYTAHIEVEEVLTAVHTYVCMYVS